MGSITEALGWVATSFAAGSVGSLIAVGSQELAEGSAQIAAGALGSVIPDITDPV